MENLNSLSDAELAWKLRANRTEIIRLVELGEALAVFLRGRGYSIDPCGYKNGSFTEYSIEKVTKTRI